MTNSYALWDGKPIEYWVRALHDPEDEARWAAVDALRHIAHPSQTIGLFIGALGDRYWRVRALAAHSLYDMAHQEELITLLREAVSPLAKALSDEFPDVGLNAAYALELLGPRAGAALPQLREAAGYSDDRLRHAASDAISRITG
jgi:HEAT repeat protein